MTMEKYTIYCTAEQTRKALELGAPIISYHNAFTTNDIPHYTIEEGNGNCTLYIIPTAEQMISWLEEQGIVMDASGAFNHSDTPVFMYRIGFRFNYFESDAIDYPTRKEATLAAIDAALDYLSKNK